MRRSGKRPGRRTQQNDRGQRGAKFGNDQGDRRDKTNRPGGEKKDQGARSKRRGDQIRNARGLRDVVSGSPRPIREDMRTRAPVPGPVEGQTKGPQAYQPVFSFPIPQVSGVTQANPQPSRAATMGPRPPAVGHEHAWPASRLKGERVSPKSQSRPTTSASEKSARQPQRARSGRSVGTRLEGVIKRHPDGFGFLLPTSADHEDVYVPKHEMQGIMTNDIIEVEVFSAAGGFGQRSEKRYHGEVVRVVRRANERIVGRFLPVDVRYGIIQDDQRGWGADLRIATENSLGAKDGDLVAVEVLAFPDGQAEFSGRVIEVIGSHDDPMNDVRRVIHTQGLPFEFSPAAEAQAKAFGSEVTERDRRGREDVRQLSLITIDGATARDFDDAIYVEETPRGFRLLTAIADVSHYVKPGTDLDHDAYERGNSTYFPNFVIPMLPEELSNELCSLRPNVERLCFCCDMTISRAGELESYRFFEGVMKSRARVTYGEAQEVIDGQSLPQFSHVADMIRKASGLAEILMKKRHREGSLDLEIPETQVVVNEAGDAIDIVRSERLFAHRLIEELMLVTNIAAARFLRDQNVDGIFRVHEPPKEDNLTLLEGMLWNLGRQSLRGGKLQTKLTGALKKFASHAAGPALNIMTLRSMQQARYSAENVGHFGLGFSDYSHFTSPIRRYPDLILHRLIKSCLKPTEAHLRMTREEIESASVHLSATEQRSTKAERNLVSIKKARFMSQFVGREFPGMISSVTRFGVFVALKQYDVDGLIKLEELGNDRFDFDEEKMVLVGRRSRRVYALGDGVTVQVVACDVSTGKIDLHLGQTERAQAVRGRRTAAETPSAKRPSSKDRKDQRRGKSAKGSEKETKAGAGVDASKRSSAANNRRSVRKKRVSKRR